MKPHRLLIVAALACGAFVGVAHADFTGVTSPLPLSTSGFSAAITPAPAFALDAMVTNLAQEGFEEMHGVLLAAPLAVDAGFIPAGTTVNSHMIFLNAPTSVPGLSHAGVTWTFANPIIGVMSDFTGALEVASSPLLGAAGTTYPGAPFAARGFEGGDVYGVAGPAITVSMFVSQPGDWIRVITIPAPGAAMLGLVGLPLIGWIKRRVA